MEKTVYADGEVLTLEEVEERLNRKRKCRDAIYWNIGCNIVMLINDIETAINYRKSVAELDNALEALRKVEEENESI